MLKGASKNDKSQCERIDPCVTSSKFQQELEEAALPKCQELPPQWSPALDWHFPNADYWTFVSLVPAPMLLGSTDQADLFSPYKVSSCAWYLCGADAPGQEEALQGNWSTEELVETLNDQASYWKWCAPGGIDSSKDGAGGATPTGLGSTLTEESCRSPTCSSSPFPRPSPGMFKAGELEGGCLPKEAMLPIKSTFIHFNCEAFSPGSRRRCRSL